MPVVSPSDAPRGFSFFGRARESASVEVPGVSAGQVIGDFRLVRPLGQGGMGQVWEAVQLSLGRTVALKLVRPERITEKTLALFAREARAGGRLHHPHLVTVHGHGTDGGIAWIAMELVDGSWTLRDFLDDVIKSGEVPAGYYRDVADFVARIADGMHAAHTAGVIHRDLKPQNILVDPDDRPKVTDFGLAKLTDESALSVTGDFAGTYWYTSPEQVAARRMGLDHRTDIFSLGVVLYEMLSQRRPFDGDTTHQVAEQVLTFEPPDLCTVRSRIPRDLAVITAKCLAKARDRRYATMAELAADLRRHLGNEPIHAKPPSRLVKLILWARRNPTKSVAGGVAAIAFGVISLLLAANIEQSRRLQESNDLLEDQTEEATRRANDVLSLSAQKDLDDLVAEAERLWPAHPETIPAYEHWLRRAKILSDGVAEDPALGQKRRPSLAEHRATLANLRNRARALPDVVAIRPTFEYEDPEDAWWDRQLAKLVAELEAFSDPRTGLAGDTLAEPFGWGVTKRYEFARTIQDRSVEGPQARERWSEATAAIEASPRYGGLRLAPQLGLLPIGMDPESELWEFAHLQTGEAALRGPNGRLVLTEATGVVLVLIPGGTFSMGAQSTDPNGRNYDTEATSFESPAHEVELSPYFLAKHEFTQAQWQRHAARNPSYYGHETYLDEWNRAREGWSGLHPVEQVSWYDCLAQAQSLGLVLPTEAQWEHGCRAGTDTPFWVGEATEALATAANLSDAYARANRGPFGRWEEWDDGNTCHTRVGCYRANRFGLHDTHGNVWEWCLDGFEDYPQGRAIDPIAPWDASADRVIRGGSFSFSAAHARSAYRYNYTPEFRGGHLGFRVAKGITP